DEGLKGDYPAAEKVDRTIIRIGQRRNDPAMTAVGQTLGGGVLREAGDYNAGLAMFREALAYYDRDPKPSVEKMSVCQGLGITYLQQGNFRLALTNLQRALHLARELHDPRGIIPALNSLGELFRTQGQPERALELYEQARREVGDDSAWNMAFIFNNIGMAYEAMGESGKAIENINRSRVVAKKVNFRPRVATALAVLGQLHLAANEPAEAARNYQQSLDLSRELHDKASQARALVGLSETLRSRKQFAPALDDVNAAIQIYRDVEAHDALIDAQTEAGRCLLSLGKTEEAASAFDAAISEMEKLRGQVVGGAEESERFFGPRIAPYHEMVALLLDEGKPEDALIIAERASARALLDILANGRSQTPLPPNDRAAEQSARLDAKLAVANRRLQEEKADSSPAQLERLSADLNHLRAEREIFDAQSTSRETVPSAQPLTLAELSPLLRKGKNVLLKFVVTPDRTFLFVVSEKDGTPSLQTFAVALAENDLARRVAEFRALLAERGLDWQEPAHALYTTLLQSSEALWKSASSLTIIPDGPLWELPCHALQNAQHHSLLEEHAVSYAPSLAFLARVRAKATLEPKAPRLFALADPALAPKKSDAATFSAPLIDKAWETLPASDKQVAELEKIYAPAENLVLTGAAAREDTFKHRAGDFDILHFATHGVINDRAPLYSYLLMSQRDLSPNEDGLLEAWELTRMKLHARLAVLSACETARGKISDGEGTIGLAWAFLAAGCPAEVVSQWKVDSAVDGELMVNFHRRLRAGVPAAEALRLASLDLAKNENYRHPFYWAPFIVIGE
ncbi:MAG TPA: CHAT domain-containing tetratricopeptide repeat protein, partial [Chthoniobacterales bacterium]